jgi:hypothetical protein
MSEQLISELTKELEENKQKESAAIQEAMRIYKAAGERAYNVHFATKVTPLQERAMKITETLITMGALKRPEYVRDGGRRKTRRSKRRSSKKSRSKQSRRSKVSRR